MLLWCRSVLSIRQNEMIFLLGCLCSLSNALSNRGISLFMEREIRITGSGVAVLDMLKLTSAGFRMMLLSAK